MFDEQGNRELAAKAAINGAGFGWYGRFGGTGNMPNFKNITEVPARLQLIRVLTNWEDKNATPHSKRNWNGMVYKSPTAYISPDAIAILQPGTKKLFIVFNTINGQIPIPAGREISSVSSTDSLFIESGSGSADIIKSNTIKPRTTAALNKGYILQLK